MDRDYCNERFDTRCPSTSETGYVLEDEIAGAISVIILFISFIFLLKRVGEFFSFFLLLSVVIFSVQ
eukprot:gene4313-3127_t